MDGAVYEIWQFSEKILSKAARRDSFGLFKYIKEEKKMFRPMRRSKQALSAQETKALLSAEKRGILAVNGDEGYPFAIPVNYYYDDAQGKIFIHGGKAGHKVDALKRDDKVCFTVYGNESFEEGDWAPYLHSVVVFGRCKLVADAGQTEDRVDVYKRQPKKGRQAKPALRSKVMNSLFPKPFRCLKITLSTV